MGYDALFDTPENKALLAICARKLIRNVGVGGVFWGLLNTGFGVVAALESLINVGVLLLGVLMLSAGVRAVWRPSLGALLVEANVSALIFLWNISMSVYNYCVAGVIDLRGLIVPLVVAWVFAGYYRKLRHLREMIRAIEPARIESMKQASKELLKAKLKTEPLVVQMNGQACRARLMENAALFMQRNQMRAFIASSDDIRRAVNDVADRRWRMTFNHPLGKLVYRMDKTNTAKMRAWLPGSESQKLPAGAAPA